MTERQRYNEVLQRFGSSKCATDLSSILPAVAGGPVGAYLGRMVGDRLGQKDLGTMLGAVGGGVLGKVVGDQMQQQPPQPQMPMGSPYAIDPTSEDIPPWALAGAQLLRPTLKQSNWQGAVDVIGGDTLGSLSPGIDYLRGKTDAAQTGKNMLGQTAGVVGGGLLGHGAGHLLTHLVGKDYNIPGLNLPVSTILSGLGATIGGAKGLQYARGRV